MKRVIASIALAGTVFIGGQALAGSLENLERERAMAIETMLSADMNPAERQNKLGEAKQRLVDLERMVLRDEKLKGDTSPKVRLAFRNYDLTFLVHAAVEKDRSISDQWLGELGLTTDALMNARIGRR